MDAGERCYTADGREIERHVARIPDVVNVVDHTGGQSRIQPARLPGPRRPRWSAEPLGRPPFRCCPTCRSEFSHNSTWQPSSCRHLAWQHVGTENHDVRAHIQLPFSDHSDSVRHVLDHPVLVEPAPWERPWARLASAVAATDRPRTDKPSIQSPRHLIYQSQNNLTYALPQYRMESPPLRPPLCF
jgi:hypothetical protein